MLGDECLIYPVQMTARPFEEFGTSQCVFTSRVHRPDAIPAYAEMHYISVTLNLAWTSWEAEALPSQSLCSSAPAKGVLERDKLMELVSWESARRAAGARSPALSCLGLDDLWSPPGQGPSHRHGPGVGGACSSLATYNSY